MISHQELSEDGDSLKLTNYINSDDVERENWQKVQDGKGYIYDNGQLVGREIARIPVEEAAMLEAMCDIDYLSFSRNKDKAALRRLLKRYPYWRSSSGGV